MYIMYVMCESDTMAAGSTVPSSLDPVAPINKDVSPELLPQYTTLNIYIFGTLFYILLLARLALLTSNIRAVVTLLITYSKNRQTLENKGSRILLTNLKKH